MLNLYSANSRNGFTERKRRLYKKKEGTSVWVVPSKYIVTSEGVDKEAFFDPADDKLYRHPHFLRNSNDVKICNKNKTPIIDK